MTTATLKPYRTWEVKPAGIDGAHPPLYPWYVLEKNPKKWGVMNQQCYGFKTEEEAKAYAAKLTERDMEKEKIKAARRAERAAARKATPNLFKVGMIFENSWGYDQTNVDYYQVVRLTPRGVYVRPIGAKSVVNSGSHQGMSDRCVPDKDAFIGDEQFKPIIRDYKGEPRIAAEFGCMTLINEWEAHYRSWYA